MPLFETGHHTAAKAPFAKFESHNDFTAAAENSSVQELFHLFNSMLGICVRADVTSHQQDTVETVHQTAHGWRK